MQVLPVIDLLRHQVVRGVAGNRAAYRPIKSRLCESSSPENIASALVREFGFRQCYVADLDAIAGNEPNWPTYTTIASAGMRIWLDAGTGSLSRLLPILAFDRNASVIERIIVGSESLESAEDLPDIVQTVGTDRCVFSLDLRAGEPLVKPGAWPMLLSESASTAKTIDAIIERIAQAGISNMILLDLAGVGAGKGISTLKLCRKVRSQYPAMQLISGGGVRDTADLRALYQAHCSFALVASALHDGHIERAGISRVENAAKK